MTLEDRSEALIEVLAELEESDIPFVLVGGYAISQCSFNRCLASSSSTQPGRAGVV
jgi:hypothetical protein